MGEDVATLYKAFGEGTDVRILANDSAVTGIEHPLGSSLAFPVTKVQGTAAGINDTHVTIGEVSFEIHADNPCNTGGRKYPQGPRKLFHDHLHGTHRNLQELTTVDNTKGGKVYDAVIVGAGWAGISAAAELLNKGVDSILILEANNYIGGRSHTITNFATSPQGKDVPFELGSEFLFTAWDNEIVDIFDEYDVNSEVLGFGEVGVFFDQDFPDLETSFVDDTSYKNLRSQIWNNGFLEYLSKHASSGVDMETIVKGFEDEQAMDDDLANQFFETEVNNNLIVEFGAPLDDLSSSKNADWLHEVSNAKSAIVSIPGGGYGIAKSVRFGAAVTKIRYDDDLVQIDFDKDGESQSVLAQTVLVTASVGVLQSDYIKFEPELPEEKLEAIDSMDMGVLDKLVMYWDEDTMASSPDFKAKWDENMDNIWLELVTPKSETSDDWTVFFNSRKYNGLHSLSAWIGGSAALEMEAKNDNVVLDEVLTNP